MRLEQFYPFPADKLNNELENIRTLKLYGVKRNQKYGRMVLCQPIDRRGIVWPQCSSKRPKCIARPAAASPACGYANIHAQQQAEILKQVAQVQLYKH